MKVGEVGAFLLLRNRQFAHITDRQLAEVNLMGGLVPSRPKIRASHEFIQDLDCEWALTPNGLQALCAVRPDHVTLISLISS